jgi:uncharacterized membrane protein
MFNYLEIILLFFIYGFIGWIWEVILSLFEHHKLINRGFLIGPILPIYGVGGFIATIFFTGLANNTDNTILNIIYIFLGTTLICSILEYFTSWFMEKQFHTRWWDYSKMFLNLNGRICLLCSLGFGAGCTATLMIINPYLRTLFDNLNLSTQVLKITDLSLLLIFIIDLAISFKIINNFKHISDNVKEDNTEKITSLVKKTVIDNYNMLYRRLVESFPNIKIYNRLSQLRDKIIEQQKKIEKAAYKLDMRKIKLKNLQNELNYRKKQNFKEKLINAFKRK